MNQDQVSYVYRTVELPPTEAARAFDRVARAAGLADGRLVLERPGSPVPPDGIHYWPLRTMTGRLRIGWRRSVPVELAVLPWSQHRAEVSIRPNTRHAPRGARYERVATDVVDRIAAAVEARARGRLAPEVEAEVPAA